MLQKCVKDDDLDCKIDEDDNSDCSLDEDDNSDCNLDTVGSMGSLHAIVTPFPERSFNMGMDSPLLKGTAIVTHFEHLILSLFAL